MQMDLESALIAVFQCEASDDEGFGATAWAAVLTAVEAGTLDVNVVYYRRSLLSYAATHCSATVVKRLLHLGASPSVEDKYGTRPMHKAVLGGHDVVAKCAMLPPGDLACQSKLFGTPLHECAFWLKRWAPPHELFDKYLEVLQWMLAQPECPVRGADIYGRTAMDILNGSEHCSKARDMLAAELARRARWTALRAAWIGVVVAEKASW
jgi:hypothetical protein